MTNAAPPAIYSLLLPNLLYFPHDSFAVERIWERSYRGGYQRRKKQLREGPLQ
jgi:hypothetical protein